MSAANTPTSDAVLAELNNTPRSAKNIAAKLGLSTHIVGNALNFLRTKGLSHQFHGQGWVGADPAKGALDDLDAALRRIKQVPSIPAEADCAATGVVDVIRLEGGSGLAEITPTGRIIKFGNGHKSANDTIGCGGTVYSASSVAYETSITGLAA